MWDIVYGSDTFKFMKTSSGSAVILGLMSGTSLDGLDLACVEFTWSQESVSTQSKNKYETTWSYRFIQTQGVPYDDLWKSRLQSAADLSARDLEKLHREYGNYLGHHASTFLTDHGLDPLLIASHGHTVFHEPAQRYTLQIGGLEEIASATQRAVAGDFRSLDVARGGQGAPLVPIGDSLLFPEYCACVNLGGFCNVSYDIGNSRTAFDLGVCNLLLNQLSESLPGGVDWGGKLAREGQVIPSLLDHLRDDPYYSLPSPRSLDRVWYDKMLWPIVQTYLGEYSRADLLATACHHIAWSIAMQLELPRESALLLTGGGAHNDYLVECIREQLPYGNIVVPDEQLIEFKEALIFALLGLLRSHDQINVLASVTGADRDSVAGLICRP